jgi:hypothetical protein
MISAAQGAKTCRVELIRKDHPSGPAPALRRLIIALLKNVSEIVDKLWTNRGLFGFCVIMDHSIRHFPQNAFLGYIILYTVRNYIFFY